MKRLATFSLLLLAAVAIPYATGQRAEDRPPGISANSWIAVSENLGVVLAPLEGADKRPMGRSDAQALLLAPPANGYFMVRTANRWTRLVVVEPLRGPGDAG